MLTNKNPYFPLQQNRMLLQTKSKTVSSEKYPEEHEKQRSLNILTQELEYLLPRRHRYFCKPYRIDSLTNEVPLLLRDMDDYRQLLTAQAKKILAYLHAYQLDAALNSLLATILRYFEEFAGQSARMAGKLGKRGVEEERGSVREGKCSECERALSEYRVQQVREELQLNRFQDHFNFFNVDHLNFQELGRLQRESKALLQGELGQDSQFEFQGGCISFEQYEEVLNLLGSDLHQKNASIEKIIDYLQKTDKRLLGEDRGEGRRQGQTQEQLRRFDAMVAGDSIRERLRDMVWLFFKRYLQYKIYKRKDAEVQVNIKENDVIRQLEREKKHLKNRIYALATEKERIVMDYQNRLKGVQLQLETNVAQFREQITRAAEQAEKQAQRYAEERHLHDLHKLELEHLTDEYTSLLALVNSRNINLERQARTNSKGSKRTSSRRSKNKQKTKVTVKRQRSSFAVPNGSQNQIQNDSSKNLHKSKGKDGSSKKLLEVRVDNTSLKQIGKLGSYLKIDQKQEEEEGETPHNKVMKRKTSRFKILMSHFNSNATIQQEASRAAITHSQSPSPSPPPSLTAIHHSEHPVALAEPRTSAENSLGKQSQQSRYQMLLRLFESQRSNQQLTLPFPNFLQLYNDFITTISSEKVLHRSSSLKPRGSRISSKQDTPSHSRTAKSISEEIEKVQVGRKSSKLEPIIDKVDKKSQYFLKKVGKSKKQFDFKSFSRTAEQTLRTEQLVSIKDVQVESSNFSEQAPHLYPSFTDQELNDIFMGKQNIPKFEEQLGKGEKGDAEPGPQSENQFLMRIYAQMANLHIKNIKDYEQVKVVLSHPREAFARQAAPALRQDKVNQLKIALKCVVRLHRQCRKEKGKTECVHLTRLARKVHQLSTDNTSLKVVDSEAS